MNKILENKKGFTIIEVVVVLAIAGLIFGIVFWALPNLQKSNRDSTRRTIVANVLANLDQYAANNNGNYPAATTGSFDAGFLTDFFTDGFDDPLAGSFLAIDNVNETEIVWGTGIVTGDDTKRTLRYATSASCDVSAPGTIMNGPGTRAIAISIELEQGAGYCVDNN